MSLHVRWEATVCCWPPLRIRALADSRPASKPPNCQAAPPRTSGSSTGPTGSCRATTPLLRSSFSALTVARSAQGSSLPGPGCGHSDSPARPEAPGAGSRSYFFRQVPFAECEQNMGDGRAAARACHHPAHRNTRRAAPAHGQRCRPARVGAWHRPFRTRLAASGPAGKLI